MGRLATVVGRPPAPFVICCNWFRTSTSGTASSEEILCVAPVRIVLQHGSASQQEDQANGASTLYANAMEKALVDGQNSVNRAVMLRDALFVVAGNMQNDSPVAEPLIAQSSFSGGYHAAGLYGRGVQDRERMQGFKRNW